MATAVLVLVRGVRARIELWGDALVVRDYLFSTRIPRHRIMTVHRFPSIDWRDSDGIPRETLVNAFDPQQSPLIGPTNADLSRIREQLQTWLDT
ncbi:hypothetical protein J7E22_13035 [Curtobacterium sp. ISL-83]|nr:hypothetical protein [Curtobacterium sp. ISL-83]